MTPTGTELIAKLASDSADERHASELEFQLVRGATRQVHSELRSVRKTLRDAAAAARKVQPIYELDERRDHSAAFQLVRSMFDLTGVDGGRVAITAAPHLPLELIVRAVTEELDEIAFNIALGPWAHGIVAAAVVMADADAWRRESALLAVHRSAPPARDPMMRVAQNPWEEFLILRSRLVPRGWAAGIKRLHEDLNKLRKRDARRL